MGYAVDMVKTDRFGFTTRGFVPPSTEGYLIFGEAIVSPIAGIVAAVIDGVVPGDMIGRIGNSGLSERPHLHMQASHAEDGNFWKGEGVPLLFEGSVPLKGRVFRGME